MTTTFAALKGNLGSTEYFVIAMKAKELTEKAIIPSKIKGWDNMTLEEREQRDINYVRVKNQIAPYLAKDKDRFLSAVILAAQNFNPNNFESITDFIPAKVPKAYRPQGKLMGFLTLTGGELLIPLDGQHRLKAIQFAIEGKDHKGQKISGLQPSSDLANEDVTVILIPYDNKKSRKIFTKINRYAKPTTTGQNLMMDDDDFVAVSARGIANDIISPDLVKYTSNTLTDNDRYFSTLATIAACNEVILRESFPPLDRTQPIADIELQTMLMEKIEDVWEHLLENIEEFSFMLSDKTETGDEKRREIRRDYLLGKPVPQLCLVKAFIKMANSNNLTFKKVSDKLNKIDWRKDADIWDRLLISGNKILTKNAKVATDIIFYMCGGKIYIDGKVDTAHEKKLLEEYRKLFPPGSDVKLPPKV